MTYKVIRKKKKTLGETNLMPCCDTRARARGGVGMSKSLAAEVKESGSPDSSALLLEVSLQKLSDN